MVTERNLLELKREDLPIRVRLQIEGGWKEYLLVRTKQDKLLLNKGLDPHKQ